MADSMADYLAIKAVSAGVLRTLIDECPAAAFYCSAFNPTPPPPEYADASDAGTIIHSILLEGSTDCVVVLDPQDYPAEKTGNIPLGFTNKAIRAARDEARSAGKIPLLKPDWADIAAAVVSAQKYIESLKNTEPAIWSAFQPGGGRSEETIQFDFWDVPCKIRPDRISSDNALMIDLKTTLTSAAPESWARSQLIGRGLYLSSSFYPRGVATKFKARAEYVYLVVSQSPPYLCSLVALDNIGLDLAERKVDFALRRWKKCADANHFPAYENRVSYFEMPPWESARWEEQEIRDPQLGAQA